MSQQYFPTLWVERMFPSDEFLSQERPRFWRRRQKQRPLVRRASMRLLLRMFLGLMYSVGFWLVGLALAVVGGCVPGYLQSIGPYIFVAGETYGLLALRWASTEYRRCVQEVYDAFENSEVVKK